MFAFSNYNSDSDSDRMVVAVVTVTMVMMVTGRTQTKMGSKLFCYSFAEKWQHNNRLNEWVWNCESVNDEWIFPLFLLVRVSVSHGKRFMPFISTLRYPTEKRYNFNDKIPNKSFSRMEFYFKSFFYRISVPFRSISICFMLLIIISHFHHSTSNAQHFRVIFFIFFLQNWSRYPFRFRANKTLSSAVKQCATFNVATRRCVLKDFNHSHKSKSLCTLHKTTWDKQID